MINISNTLKNACNSDKITYREYVVLDGTTAPIEVMTEMYATAYKDTHFIGTFNMKYIKFTTSNDVQYRNKELTLYKEINGGSFKVGNFIVTEIKDNDSNEEVTVTAYDYALKFAQPYKTELPYGNGNITLKDVLDEICDNVGIELVNTTITNGDFIVDSNQFVNGEVYGDVISSIAYLSGDFATINNDDKLEFIFNKTTNEIIEDYVELEDKRDTQPITSLSIGTSVVEGQNAVIKDQSLIDKYGEHWLIINDVPFAYTLEKREQLKTQIFNKVKGFGYSSFKSEYSFKPYLTIGDLVQFRNKEGQLVNSIVLRFTSKYDNIILEAPSVTSSTINYEKPETSYDVAKRAEIIANQNTAELNLLANKVVDISQKIISGGSVTLENAYEGQLHRLSIKGNISLLFPNSQNNLYGYGLAPREELAPTSTLIPSSPVPKDNEVLYPSNNLFGKDTILLIDDQQYKLDFNFLNYINNEICDEFIYEEGKCWIVRRVGVNSDGELYKLEHETFEHKKNIFLNVKSNSVIKLKSFDNAIYEVNYLLDNEYTSSFSTKAELQSEINVRTDEIEILTKGKVGDDEIVAKINTAIEDGQGVINLTGNQVTIDSDNFKLDANGDMTCNNANVTGTVNSTNGNIGGWIINKDGLNNGVVKLNSDGSSTIYTVADLIIIRGYIMETPGFALPPQMIQHYDMNGDGIVNAQDYIILQNLIGISMN